MVRGFERVPALYDLAMNVIEAGGLRWWRRRLLSGISGRVLDLGCGTGRSLPLFRSKARVVGADPALDMLLRARRRVPGALLVVARAEELPFADRAFDVVVSALVFCSVDDPGRGLSEVGRVLAPDGRLRMLEHVRSATPWVARFQDLAQPLWTLVSGGCHPNRDTEQAVTQAGFTIDRVTRRAARSVRMLSAHPASGATASGGAGDAPIPGASLTRRSISSSCR